MRLITTLSLGVAALALAGVPLYAQNAVPAGGVPAVPFAPAPQATRQTPPTTTPPTAAPTTSAAAAPAATAPAAKPATAPASGVTSNGIVAVVNEQSISDYELEQRVAFAIAVSGNGNKLSEEQLKQIRASTLQRMEEEKIQLGEARRLKVTVSPVEINEQIDTFLKEQGASKEELSKVLANAGTSLETFRNQQTAFLAWQKVIRDAFAGDPIITQAQIDDAMRRAIEGANKPQYRVAEIFLAVDSDRPEDDAKVKAQMEEIEKQIRGGAPFRSLAKQYSRNPSAAQGGDMGIVYDGQLEPELNTVVASLKRGELSHPVRAKGGWYLLLGVERIEPLGTSVTEEPPAPSGPPGTLPLARLSLVLPPGAPKEAIDNTMRLAMQVRDVSESCAAMEKLAANEPVLKGAVFTNMGNVTVSELHPELKKALEQTKSGEIAMPVMLDSGVEIFARCDKRAAPPRTVFKIPTRDEIEQRLFQEQIAALARRHLRDLKRDASVVERGRDSILDAALVK